MKIFVRSGIVTQHSNPAPSAVWPDALYHLDERGGQVLQTEFIIRFFFFCISTLIVVVSVPALLFPLCRVVNSNMVTDKAAALKEKRPNEAFGRYRSSGNLGKNIGYTTAVIVYSTWPSYPRELSNTFLTTFT